MRNIALTILFATVCTTSIAQSSRDPLVKRLGAAQSQFAQRLYSQVAGEKASENLILAPYGVFESLSMLQLGSSGDTTDRIARVTGIRPDQVTLAAFKRARQQAAPTSLRFGATVSDNDGYGVKLTDQPSDELTALGISKGDLIFSVDGRPVRTAREFLDTCATSIGAVQIDGFSRERGVLFTRLTAPLERVRELNVEPHSQVVNFASALWLRDNLVEGSKFPSQLSKLFETRTFPSTFRSAETITEQANEFFNSQTGGRIDKVDMPNQFSPNTAMILMNAMTMDAKWERQFKTALTKPGTFAAPDGDTQTDYMRQQSIFAFASSRSVKVVELPYRNTDLRMTVFLPIDPEGWKNIESAFFLDKLELHNLARQMRPTRLDLKLPRFDLRMSGSLKASVQKLGLGSLFTSEADFTGIDSRDRVMLDDMRQQVYVTTNEEGTRAGSVTKATGVLKSVPVKAEPFHAIHPFLFLIRDSYGIVYFAGRVTHPAPHPDTAAE